MVVVVDDGRNNNCGRKISLYNYEWFLWRDNTDDLNNDAFTMTGILNVLYITVRHQLQNTKEEAKDKKEDFKMKNDINFKF